MFFFSEGFTFRNFLADAFAVFFFVLWFWLLIVVIGDLFRRHDISGWGKAIWVIALIVFPYLSIFAYMITQSTGMAERSVSKRSRHVKSCDRWSATALRTRSKSSTGSRNRDRSRIRSSPACAPSWFNSRIGPESLQGTRSGRRAG
jgi:hypothetical protein